MATLLSQNIPIPEEDFRQTPKSFIEFVQGLLEERERLLTVIQGLKARIERLEARLNQDSSNSDKPPSSDNPFKVEKTEPPTPKTRRKRKGIRQQCLRPTEIKEVFPGICRCGCSKMLGLEAYYIHQFLELPIIQLIVQHIILYRGRCAQCGRTVKALIPPSQRAGFGPYISALIAELCGVHGDCRRGVQDFLFSVLGLPISQGGLQKVLDRVSKALEPHYDAIEAEVHAASVNHVDETSWRRKGKLRWLWVLANAAAALFMIHAERSKAAFQLLIKDWAGILVSDGYGVYRKWTGLRQACLAHLIRKAEGLSEQKNAQIARCGAWALKELRLLCHMAHAPPTRGEWSAFYARFIRLISMYEGRPDDAGKLARHLRRELEHLWLFLQEEGVAPTNNHAERMLRFGVLWRKRSLGSINDKGDRWVERILSLRQTCRIRGRRTYPVLVDAMNSFFSGGHPNISWIQEKKICPREPLRFILPVL